jgi:hypothetical protein
VSLSALLQTGQPSSHKVDKVLLAYQSLSGSEKEAFEQLIHDELWSGPQIASALRGLGHQIDGGQIKHFRTKLRDGKVTL